MKISFLAILVCILSMIAVSGATSSGYGGGIRRGHSSKGGRFYSRGNRGGKSSGHGGGRSRGYGGGRSSGHGGFRKSSYHG
uniref:Uncharacterized protein n=1 Tax=Lepeophtheirus salmonis TaxID=72036 RepID=A0A0K2VB68_LEPSM